MTLVLDSSSYYWGGRGGSARVCMSERNVTFLKKTLAQNGTDVKRTENAGLRMKSIIIEPRGKKLESKREGDPNV